MSATMKSGALLAICPERSTVLSRTLRLSATSGYRMSTAPQLPQIETNMVNPKTGMTHDEMTLFVRCQFEDFVNRKNLDIADVNFGREFVDHGSDVPLNLPPGPQGAKTLQVQLQSSPTCV